MNHIGLQYKQDVYKKIVIHNIEFPHTHLRGLATPDGCVPFGRNDTFILLYIVLINQSIIKKYILWCDL